MRAQYSLSILICGTTLLGACTGGNNNEDTVDPSQAIFADTNAPTLASQILTGRDSADNNTHWLCELSNESELRENYILNFWADQTGVAGNENMSWFTANEEQVTIEWGSNQVSLNNFIFDESNDQSIFSATSSKNDRLDCQLNGPKPLPSDVLQDFAPLFSEQIVNDRSDQSDTWTCTATDLSGARTERHYAFWRNAMGTSEIGNFTWYYNEDENIVISYESQVRELRSIRYADDSLTPNNFTALDRQHTLNCSR